LTERFFSNFFPFVALTCIRAPASDRTMGSSYDSSVVVPKEASPTSHRHQDSLDYAETGDEYHSSIQGHTRADNRDMQRMGKIQELRRNYRPLSALAFTVILQGVWEVLLT
jgi:choline transport protein